MTGQSTDILGTAILSAMSQTSVKEYSRVCKDLNWEARHGVLAKSAQDDFAPVLAGPLDDEPSDHH